MRAFIYRVGYWLATGYWFIRRPQVAGARCILRNAAGQVLLIRHTYTRRGEFNFPGGAFRRRETPVACAVRETREETGYEAVEARELGRIYRFEDFKHCTVHVIVAQASSSEGRRDAAEIAEMRWVAPAEVPALVGETGRQLWEKSLD